MRILFIPFDTKDILSNHAFGSRIYRLSLEDKVMGVARNRSFSAPSKGFLSYVKFVTYGLRASFFGLSHRKDFDLIYCYASHTLFGAVTSIITGKPCVEEKGGVSRVWSRKVGKSGLYIMVTIISEKITAMFAKKTIVLSEADKRSYIKYGFNPEKIVVIPPFVNFSLADGVAISKEVLRKKLGLEKYGRIVIFTGTRESPENKLAVWWINKELAPTIARECGQTQILLTGSGPIPDYPHPIMTFTGFVPNVFEYILAADVCLAPMEQPEGLLTKVLDSISCSKPTVVMASAINGIPELTDGYNAMVAKDKKEFIQKTIYLLKNLGEAKVIGDRARKTLEEHYSWEFSKGKFIQTLGECIS